MMVPVLEATMVLLLVSLACSKLFSTPLMETLKREIRGAGSPIPKVSFKTAAAQLPTYQGSDKSASQLFVRNQIFEHHTFQDTTRI